MRDLHVYRMNDDNDVVCAQVLKEGISDIHWKYNEQDNRRISDTVSCVHTHIKFSVDCNHSEKQPLYLISLQ